MMLVEETPVPAASLPVAEFREHLRLGTGFADDALQDTILESYLRAALSAVEARTGKALLQRRYSWMLTSWRDPEAVALPVAPASAVVAVRTFDRLGQGTDAPVESYKLVHDTHCPTVVATGASLPAVPSGGSAEIVFEAGFGTDWSSVPADLSQAVFVLAANFYENRSHVTESAGGLPSAVWALIERHRPLRIGLGARA